MRRISLVLILIAAAATPAAAKKVAADPATKSKAITDAVVDAVASEMERSMAELRINGAIAPYFLGYKLTEVEVNDVSATLGATTADKLRHFANLEAHVHVGSYQFDNSNFIASGRDGLDGIADSTLPLEANPQLARRTAWLVTDAAYKEALEQMQAKQDALKSGAAAGLPDVASYIQTKAQALTEPVLVAKLEGLPELKVRAEKISAVFRGKKQVRDSRVAFTSYLERRWLLNSEGNSVHDTRRASGVIIVASAQADDGQELTLYYSRYGLTADDLPGDDELTKAAEGLVSRLDALKKAPLAGAYTGPILFEGDGAVGMARSTLAPHLSGTPVPVGLAGAAADRFGGDLADRIGLRIIAPVLSVVDDPTTQRADKQAMIGGFKIDDEGVPSQRVEVIKDGKLIDLLMSRTPSKKLTASNGHARLAMPGGIFRGSTTNLLIAGKGGVATRALRAKLLAEAKSQGLGYALIIRQFDDPALTASGEITRLERLQLLQGVDEAAPPAATLAYKLYPDGHEELVRGVQLKPVELRAWRDVMAVSSTRTVRNYLASTDNPLLVQVAGTGAGFVPSAGVESAIATPDLLFRELDVVNATTGHWPAPAIAAP